MSIRKRKWTNAKGETVERWTADYFDQAGQRHQPLFERKRDAEAFLAQAKVDVRAGVHSPDSGSLTIKEAADLWLFDREDAQLERSTIAQYRQHIELHIVPFIGNIKLSRFSIPALSDYRDALRRADKPRSQALIAKVMVSLGSLIGHAKSCGKFSGTNPVRELSRSKRSGENSGRKKLEIGRDIPTREEIKSLLAAIPADQEPLIQIAVFCGLRASEIRGLRWSDVDLKLGELHVRQRADKYCKIGPPKSRAGNRKVPIPPSLTRQLTEWRDRCPASDSGLVFPTKTGLVQHHKNIVRDLLDPALVKAKLVDQDGSGKYGLHSLRHFFASWLINRKVDGGREMPLKAVQGLMGHSSIVVTADRYGHLFPRGDDASELADAEASILGH